jgi:hypothetical protein
MKMSEFKTLICEEIKRVLSEDSYAAIDKQIDRERKQAELKGKSYVRTPNGKALVNAIKALINKPYGHSDLNRLLKKANPTKEEFKFAAADAGMKFSSSGSGIAVFDANYKDQDVSIDTVDGKWIVG